MTMPSPSEVHALIAETSREAERCRRAWEREGFRQVSEDDFRSGKDHLKGLMRQLADLDSPAFRERALQFRFHAVRSLVARLFGLGRLDWLSASLLIAIPVIPLAALVLVAVTANLWWIVATVSALYGAGVLVLGYFLYSLDRSEFGEDPDGLGPWLKARRGEINELKWRLDRARDGLEYLHETRDVERRYQAALAELDRLGRILADRRYQLSRIDWRSLRGIPFEDFLADVLLALGYRVEKTKATGDQGVDLIVTGGGDRVAVQTKGYSDNVGNGAIQEAFTGMRFYDCHRCVAVTNSGFTQAAQTLAHKVGCVLIDGGGIPDLVAGSDPTFPPLQGRAARKP